MKNQFKRTLILTLTGILIATSPTVSVSAAAKKTKNIIKNTEKILEINTQDTENTIETNNTAKENIDNTKTDNEKKDTYDTKEVDAKKEKDDIKTNDTKEKDDTKTDDTKTDDTKTNDTKKDDIKTDDTKEKDNTKTDDTKKDNIKTDDAKKDKNNIKEIDDTKEAKQDIEKNDTKKEEKKINYTLKILSVSKSGFVADSLNGVEALYRPGRNDGSNATYSCAAFIKRYYKEVHGVTVMNLLSGRTPSSSKGSFKSVSTPQVGDVVACPSTSGSNHWAIVKQVNDNNTVTLIEQNWKWNQGGQTLCKINRSISISSGKFYHLYK